GVALLLTALQRRVHDNHSAYLSDLVGCADSGSRPQLPAGILPGDHLDGERPFDGELRVVVPGAGGGVPVVRRGGEVDDLAVVGECLVAVGTSLGDVEHGVLVGVE